MNADGYVRGAQQVTQSTEQLDKSTKEYLDSFGSLKKQMNAAKKEAQNLAAQFAMLSKEEKNSDFGKNLREQMDVAIEKAAELQDVFADTNQAIKNAASDTATWDALKSTMDIAKSATLAYAGAVAKLTGDEESLKNVVATLTMIENGFNTAIKIGNAVQKQSAVMTGLRRIQSLAAAKAVEVEKSATVGATAAQRVFNAVAKANPYVLLATVAAAAAVAVGGYMLATKKSTKEDEEAAKKAKALKDARKEYISSMAQSYGNLMGTYNQLKASWKSLSSEHEKTKWIKENKSKLDSLGISIKNVKDAENAFERNTKAVTDGFRKRAQMAALAAQAVQLYTKSMEIEQRATDRLNEIRKKAGDKDNRSGHTLDANGSTYNNGTAVLNNGVYELTAKGAAEANKELFKTDKILKGLSDDYADINKQLTENENKYTKLYSQVKQTSDAVKDVEKSTKSTKDIVVDPNVKLSEKVQKQLQKDMQAKFKKMNEDIAKSTKEMMIKMKIDPKSFDLSSIGNIQAKIQNAISEKKEYDFSFLSDALQKDADDGLKNLNRLGEGIKIAAEAKAEYMKSGNTAGVEAMDKELEKLTEDYNEQADALDKLNEKNDAIKKKTREFDDLSEAMSTAGNYIAGVGSAFTQLGQALGSTGLQAFGIIAETIANIMLSFSQALIQAASMGPWAWIAFGIQGIAQVAAMVAQIKNLTAGSYAQGGVIPGNSFSGDKLWAKVNSGERILTAEQNKNIEKIANGVYSTGVNTNPNGTIVGIIRGKDLLLMQKNTNQILKKSGQNININ